MSQGKKYIVDYAIGELKGQLEVWAENEVQAMNKAKTWAATHFTNYTRTRSFKVVEA
ncbi:hypothetical protein GCM10028810_04210 [Spirosoma litoris]